MIAVRRSYEFLVGPKDRTRFARHLERRRRARYALVIPDDIIRDQVVLMEM